MTRHTSPLWLPDALTAAGVNVVVLDGWETAQGSYLWTDIDTGGESYDGDPTCYMIHHTGTTTANPSVKDASGTWSKANCWTGLYRDGKLYQTGGGVPTVIFTSAGPARVSSGYGYWPTLEAVAQDIRVPWKQTYQDGDRAANRYAWNVETVAKGDGSPIDPGVEEALIVMGALLCDHYGWSPWRTIGHVTWSKRKIDPYWDYQQDAIVYIQDAIEQIMGDTVFTHFKIGHEYDEYEPVTWLLYLLAGGTINPNENSDQIEPYLGKDNPRLVTHDDLAAIAAHTGMTSFTADKLYASGLYRWGKEIAALNEFAYVQTPL